jgi:hypothetical protein
MDLLLTMIVVMRTVLQGKRPYLNTLRACAVARRGSCRYRGWYVACPQCMQPEVSGLSAPTCGAAETNAAMRAVTLQPAAVMSVSSGVPLEAPTTRVPSVICKVGHVVQPCQ